MRGGDKLGGRLEEVRAGGRTEKKDQGSIGQEQQVRLERGGEFKKIVVEEVRQARQERREKKEVERVSCGREREVLKEVGREIVKGECKDGG